MGGHLDSNHTFKDHIHIKCKAAILNIIKICNIRKYLPRETCHKLILQLVLSHLDYANSLLAGLPSSSIKIMQKVQNTTARLILRKHAMESTPECFTTLHWLPIQQRIDYKICTLIHKCHNKQAPVYLQNLIKNKTTICPSFRSENKKAIVEVDFLWNRTVDSLKTSFHPLMWTSSGLRDSYPSDLMKSTSLQ